MQPEEAAVHPLGHLLSDTICSHLTIFILSETCHHPPTRLVTPPSSILIKGSPVSRSFFYSRTFRTCSRPSCVLGPALHSLPHSRAASSTFPPSISLLSLSFTRLLTDTTYPRQPIQASSQFTHPPKSPPPPFSSIHSSIRPSLVNSPPLQGPTTNHRPSTTKQQQQQQQQESRKKPTPKRLSQQHSSRAKHGQPDVALSALGSENAEAGRCRLPMASRLPAQWTGSTMAAYLE
ncbi:hypothetical protein BJ546DRAFT_634999 [Cryomyces antarcticus]